RAHAIRQIGTNGLPYLLKWIEYDTPPLKRKMYQFLNPFLTKIRSSWQLNDESSQLRAEGAVLALVALCPEAEAAIPQLAGLAKDPATSPAVAARAANALAFMDCRLFRDLQTR